MTVSQRLALRDLDDNTILSVGQVLQADAPTTDSWIYCLRTGSPDEFWLGSRVGFHRFNAKTRTARNWFVTPTIKVTNPLGPVLREPDALTRSVKTMEALVATNLFAVTQRRTLYHQRRALRQAQGGATNALVHNPVDPTSRLPGPVTALCLDGDYLWLGCAIPGGASLSLYHLPTDRWVGQLQLVQATINAIAVSDSTIWVGLAVPARLGVPIHPVSMVQVDKRPWLQRSPEHGYPDAIDPKEVTSAVVRWSARQRTLYAFFKGHYAEVVQALGELDTETADLEALYMAGLAHDRFGLNQPDQQRRYLQAIIERDPNGPIAAVVRNILPPSKP